MGKSPAKPNASAKADAVKAKPGTDQAIVDAGGEGEGAKAEAGGSQLRLKELVEGVVKTTGAKPKEAREIVLATLIEIGAALDRGDSINLPEFGKGRISRKTEEADGSSVSVLKLRRGVVPKAKEDKEKLAGDAE